MEPTPSTPLTPAERAELTRLRAEKAAWANRPMSAERRRELLSKSTTGRDTLAREDAEAKKKSQTPASTTMTLARRRELLKGSVTGKGVIAKEDRQRYEAGKR